MLGFFYFYFFRSFLLFKYVILQEQQQILSTYQNLVVKQLVSQSMSRKREEADQSEEWDEETRSVQHELLVLTPQVKDLPLAQKKNTTTEFFPQKI